MKGILCNKEFWDGNCSGDVHYYPFLLSFALKSEGLLAFSYAMKGPD